MIEPHIFFYDKKSISTLLSNNNFKNYQMFYFGKKIEDMKKKEFIFGKNQYFLGLHFQIINSSGSQLRASRIRFAGDSSRTQAQGFGSGGLRQRRG